MEQEDRERNTKKQAPNTKEIPNSKLQTAARVSSLIQESVGADVRRLWFIGILKVSLLTSAPTLPRYLESAVARASTLELGTSLVFGA